MNVVKVADQITQWLRDYCQSNHMEGFVVGISGGIDSALVSILCARTQLPTLLLQMPIRQTKAENERAQEHLSRVQNDYPNVQVQVLDLAPILAVYENTLPLHLQTPLNIANLRSRIRMSTLYTFAGAHHYLVTGTGNKIEDFGVGFFTKYGDGGVDINPIGDLYKSDVFALARHLNVIDSILNAAPTDGLFEDGRTDEEQMGASYDELEWAMQYRDDSAHLSTRQREVLAIYQKLHTKNQHKMIAIPTCIIQRK